MFMRFMIYKGDNGQDIAGRFLLQLIMSSALPATPLNESPIPLPQFPFPYNKI
jgi:hypothetical protein